MSHYALTDSDWPWDDEHEGRAIVVEANTPQDAVIKATAMHLAEFPGAGGITWKVAELSDVGFQGVDWEGDNRPNFDEFVFYSDAAAEIGLHQPAPAGAKNVYEFDRYINGKLMAEGVRVERACSFEEASATAARIASRGKHGETPVLVLRP